MSKPKAAKEDASTIAMRERQVRDLTKLDEQENMRIKQLLVGRVGGRFFRGSPLLRTARPANTSPGTNATSRQVTSGPIFSPVMGPIRPPRTPTRASAY